MADIKSGLKGVRLRPSSLYNVLVGHSLSFLGKAKLLYLDYAALVGHPLTRTSKILDDAPYTMSILSFFHRVCCVVP